MRKFTSSKTNLIATELTLSREPVFKYFTIFFIQNKKKKNIYRYMYNTNRSCDSTKIMHRLNS